MKRDGESFGVRTHTTNTRGLAYGLDWLEFSLVAF